MSSSAHVNVDTGPSDLSDDELMSMYRTGDVEAFETLFDRYHVSVYNVAWHMLRDPSGAEEIMQETFLVVSRAARRYEPRGRFRAWLMGIVRNRCLSRLDSQRVRRAVVKESGLDVIKPASTAPSPSERAETDELLAAVRQAIARLPERQHEAIVLYAFEEMPYREIADALGTPVNTVKTLIHRARANLAQALQETWREKKDAV